MSEQELTDLEGMDWDIDGGHWYSVANGDVSPDRLLAYTIWLRDEHAALKRVLTRDGKITPPHLEAWADALQNENGYTGGNLEVYLRSIADVLLTAEEQE